MISSLRLFAKWLPQFSFSFPFRFETENEVEVYTHFVEYTIIGYWAEGESCSRGRRVPCNPPYESARRIRMRFLTPSPTRTLIAHPRAWPILRRGVDTSILHSRCKHGIVLLLRPFFLHSRHDCTRLRFVPISRPHTSRLAPYVSGATQRMINRTRLCRLERRRCRPRVRLTTCTGAVHLLSVPPSVASLAA